MCKTISQTVLLTVFVQSISSFSLSASLVPITGRIINETTTAPVYQAEVYILGTDLNVRSSETGSFNFLVERTNLPDTITFLVARYEYESKAIRVPLTSLNNERLTISIARYFHAPEVLNYPQLVISGRIETESGEPIEDVAIYASATTGYAYSDASGAFTLKVAQMRPHIQPTIWFYKKGYQTRELELRQFRKRTTIRLNTSPTGSRFLTVKYQNTEAELLDAVNVTLDGKIRDQTGILGTVTLGIETTFSSALRISHQYYVRARDKSRRVGGTVNLDLRSLTPEAAFILTPDLKFTLAPELRPSAIAEWKDDLPYPDSLFFAHDPQIPEVQLEKLVRSQSYIRLNKIEEPARNPFPAELTLPIIDLPEIYISAGTMATLPIPPLPDRHDELAVLITDSSEKHEANPRSAEALNRAVQCHTGSVTDCYKQALKKNPDLKGMLELRFVLTPEGTIAHVEIIFSSLAEPELEQCIIDRLMRWRNFETVDPAQGNRVYRLRYKFGKF